MNNTQIKYYEQNREKILKYHKEYYLKNHKKTKKILSEEEKTEKLQKRREYSKNWWKNHKGIYKEKEKERYIKNREQILKNNRKKYIKNKEYFKQYFQKNKDKNKEYRHLKNKEWMKKNRSYINQQINNKYINNIQFKSRMILGSRIRIALKKQNSKKQEKTIILIGCTHKQFQEHIEKQFKEGMNWNNWTLHGWHIDHIKPLSSFDLKQKEEQLKACHYTNLQPLWCYDNLSKGGKVNV